MSRLNKQGISLVQVMIIGGVIAALATYATIQIKDFDQRFSKRNKRLAYGDMVSLLREHLHNAFTCSTVLRGKNIEAAFSSGGGTADLLPFPIIYNGNRRNIFRGWKDGRGLVVTNVKLHVESTNIATGLRLDTPNSPQLTASLAEVTLHAKEGGAPLNNPKFDFFKIKVMIYHYTANGNRILYSCFSRTSAAAFCTQMGGVYNTTGSGACEPAKNCFISPAGVISSPSCPAPFIASPISEDKYLCLWCNQ